MTANNNSRSGPLVDVIMPTYNHEHYIAQAIQSVLMQECSFPYRLIVGEDCSEDGTFELCQQFAEAHADRILLLKNSSNSGMAVNYRNLFNASDAPYMAILEGDDYWLDKHKLQKQVAILESRPGVGLVHANYLAVYENGQQKKGHLWEDPEALSGQVIGPTQTANININPLTTCFRADLAKAHVDFDFIIEHQLLTVDVFLWAEVCRRSTVHYMDEVCGAYRIHDRSLTGNREIASVERFSRTSLLLVNYLMEKYETPEEIKEAYRSRNKINLTYHYLLSGQARKAKQELRQVKVTGSVKEQIIYLSAKYRALNFLSHLLAGYYRAGSTVKQLIARLKK